VRALTALLVSLAFVNDAFAQAPAPAGNPVQLAQAGGAAQGAGLPPATTGAGSSVAAVVALAIAGIAATAGYQSTVSTPSHH